MNKSVTAFSVVMIAFGLTFIIFAFTGVGVTTSQVYVINSFPISEVYAVSSLLLLIGGGIIMVSGLRSKPNLYVCGECHITFLEEAALRKHYAIEHVKKDSDEKMD